VSILEKSFILYHVSSRSCWDAGTSGSTWRSSPLSPKSHPPSQTRSTTAKILPEVTFETDESLKQGLATVAKLVMDIKPAPHWTAEMREDIQYFKSEMATHIVAPPSCVKAQKFFKKLWLVLAEKIPLDDE
jgi:hypothetical protein